MTDKPNLADLVIRDTLRPRSVLRSLTDRPTEQIRAALMQARRFVLDDEMSAFIADLATAPFRAHPQRKDMTLDSLRHGARLPHAKTWIEYSGVEFRKRLIAIGATKDAMGNELGGPDEVPEKWGFLMEEHPRIPTAVKVREFALMPMEDIPVMTMPWEWVYQTTDDPLPWHADIESGMFAHGITPYICPQIGIVFEQPNIAEKFRLQVHLPDGHKFMTHKLVAEMAGVLRYLFSFLATLNDIPVVQTTVRPQKGFVAKGSYRKFLEHTVIRLQVPQTTDRTRLATRLVVMARRRAHQVRGHWRLMAHEVQNLCITHEWAIIDEQHQHCRVCGVKRTWIHEHQRGDASIGFVTHSYSVGKRQV